MHIILIISFLLVGLTIYFISNKKKINKRISVLGGTILFFYGALRSVSVGTDIQSYRDSYLLLPNMSFYEIFNSNTEVSRDPFFYVFIKILTYINKDPQFMLIVVSAIVAVCISTFVYKYSVNPILSFTMFIGLRYFSFTLSGLRQAIALAIVILSFKYLKETKFLKFLIIVFFASLFHLSALLFIVAYPLSKIKRVDLSSLIALLTLIVNFLTHNAIVKLIVKIPIFGQYENYVQSGNTTTSGKTLLIIYIIILIFAFMVRKQIVTRYEYGYLIYNLTLVGTVITSLTFDYPNIFRSGYYFIFPIIILLPVAIKSSLNRNYQIIVLYSVNLLIAAQFIIMGPGAGTENYKFFWQ